MRPIPIEELSGRRRGAICALAAVLLLGGCALVQLRDESRAFYAANVLVGRVTAPPDWRGPVVVVATTRANGKPIVAHQVRLHEPGGYELIVPDGRYTLHAFGDRDGNGRPDRDDPAVTQPTSLDVAGNGIVMTLDLALAAGSAEGVGRALPAESPAPPAHSTQAGALADLAAPAFSAESGRRGYWAPMDAFRRTGGNIYFVEPYDPARVPVLFVHGATGSAQDWRGFFDQLDRRRFQAWFFQYPSGAALDSMANLLYWKLLNLQLRHRFERVHVVAHSMGGLVVRRFLLDHAGEFPQVRLFITLSTPWGGEPTAALGVKHSPAVVPSWRDMQPEGAFLKTLFERPLPAGVDHVLLFSHRGGYNWVRPNSDGTVTLASQLLAPAQAEARLVMGFDEDHGTILEAPSVIAQVARLLDAAGRNDVAAGGRVQAALSFDPARAAPGGLVPMLIVMPVGDEGAAARQPLFMPLTVEGVGGPLGPIAPGVYDVGVLAQAFRAAPARQRIVVESGGLTRLAFRLSPQGMLAGYVGADGDALAYPAGSYRPPHPTVTIRRLLLEGPGGQRTLVPRRSGDPQVVPAYLDGRDDAVGAMFSFVDLAPGEHALTIFADGYEPHVSRHRVEPGLAMPTTPIVLRVAR